jgi:NADH dehydrogenase/NADH:ubiquinone oxidoreductase subunit G
MEWFECAVGALDSERPRFPLRPWDDASNPSIQKVKSALRAGLTSKDEIAVHTRLKPRTVQDLLAFMHSVGEAKRERWGHYVLPEKATTDYVRPEKAILSAIAAGADTPEKIRAFTGLRDGQVAGGLHVLKKRGKIVLTAYGRYAVAGEPTDSSESIAPGQRVLHFSKVSPLPGLWSSACRKKEPETVSRREARCDSECAP